MWNRLNQLNRPRTCLFVLWTQPICRYVLVARDSPGPRVLKADSFETDQDEPSAAELQSQLDRQEIRCRQVVLLLPRAKLDIASHSLPPATEEEIPELVASAVALENDDAGTSRVSDFLVTHQDGAGCETMVFSSGEAEINDLKSEFKDAGFNLASVTYSGVGASELLKHVPARSAATTIVVATGDFDIDLVIRVNDQQVLFRSIPRPSEDTRGLADRLIAEIQRTLTLLHRAMDDSSRLCLIGDVDEHEQLARRLSERASCAVSVVDPLNEVQSDVEVDCPSRYANLFGVARAWNGEGIALDLLNPRRPPRKPSPWGRVLFWGAIAASALAIVGYFAAEDRAEQIAVIESQKTKLKNLEKRAIKSLSLEDITRAIDDWRQDDVAWLDEIHELSTRLPHQDEALIRGMSMSTDSRGNGVIDLGVQVSRPDVIARLEDAVRDDRHSVSSKRVTESDAEAKLPWGFETRIVFKPAEVPELPLADGDEDQEGGETADAADEPTLGRTDSEAEGSRE